MDLTGDFTPVKVVLCGQTGVGKTTILRKLGESLEQSAESLTEDYTSESTIDSKLITRTENGRRLKIRVFDAPAKQIHTMTDSYFRHAKVAVVLYAVDDDFATTRRSLSGWLHDLASCVDVHSTCAIVLAGNKIDTPESTWVDFDRVRALADHHDVKHRLTLSARTGSHLEQLMSLIIKAFNELPPSHNEANVDVIYPPFRPNRSCCY